MTGSRSDLSGAKGPTYFVRNIMTILFMPKMTDADRMDAITNQVSRWLEEQDNAIAAEAALRARAQRP